MKLILLLWLTLAAAPSLAQWHWIDPQGRSVFSDQPPPPNLPEKNIRRKPGTRVLPPQADTPTLAEQAAAPLVKPSQDDQALQTKRRALEEAEAAKRRAEENRAAQLRAESCVRARQARAGLDMGGRIARVNEKGEREFLDEAGIAAERQRIDAIMASDCR